MKANEPPGWQDVERRAVSLIDKGQLLQRLGQNAEALASFDKAVGICRATSDHCEPVALVLAQALDNKANALVDLERPAEAIPCFEEAIQVHAGFVRGDGTWQDVREIGVTMMNKELHAKILIADQQRAIVTSSNLTTPGLSGNAEMGVWIDDPKLIRTLTRRFDRWYDKAGMITDAELAKLEALQRKSKSQASGRQYGNRIQAGGAEPRPSLKTQTRLGWILIHSSKKYGKGKSYMSPQEELKEYEPDWKWHRKFRRPPRAGGPPLTILFAWQGTIFGEATATVTHSVENREYNCAFVLHRYRERKPVRLSKLTKRKHHGLIKLNNRILKTYYKFAG